MRWCYSRHIRRSFQHGSEYTIRSCRHRAPVILPTSVQVWPWELACDGVEMRHFVPHGTQVFVVRCAAVPPDLLCKARNVKPILVIPGPVAPRNFDPYWRLILDLFAAASPLGGVSPLSPGLRGCCRLTHIRMVSLLACSQSGCCFHNRACSVPVGRRATSPLGSCSA